MSKKKSSGKSLPQGRSVVTDGKPIEILKAAETTTTPTSKNDSKSTSADKGSGKSSNEQSK